MSESIPATDSKTGRLLPPVTCSAGRCDWQYNDRGYQCPDAAVWCAPTLDDQMRFKWLRVCDTHKPTFEAEMKECGGDVSRIRWQRIDDLAKLEADYPKNKSNAELTDAGPVTPASGETQSRHSVQ